jgi:hypothetical protein
MKELADGYLLAGIFVDDILFVNASDNKEAVQNAVKALSKYYEIKYSDTLEKFLGAEFEELDEGIYMHLNQYVTEMMSRFEIGEKTAPTPEASESDELSAADQALLLHADKKKYQEITGAVMFCMTTCRPDIAHAVNTLSRKMSAPRLCDLRTARRVLQYLNGTRRLGLLFKFETSAEHSGLLAYVDADWANDKVEQRSVSGYVVLYNGTPVSWYSGLQSVVALSTCEAEYVALTEGCREVGYLKQLMGFLREPADCPVEIREDNQGTIDLSNNPVHHKRTKHIDVKYHYVRRAQENGTVNVVKVHTDHNRADIMTKATTAPTFRRHVDALMHSPARAAA